MTNSDVFIPFLFLDHINCLVHVQAFMKPQFKEIFFRK